MQSDWVSMQIGDICSRVTSGGTPKTSNASFYEGGNIPWLNTKEVNFERVRVTEKLITEAGLAGSSAKWIPENSVIVAMYGATAGKVAVNKIPLTTNQACCNLIIDPSVADYNFVYYYLSQNYLKLLDLANGAAQQNLNSLIIKSFPITLPPIEEQKKISRILEALDDKIELNRQMNETLEAMAQALFKSWFVDFDPVIDNALAAGNEIPEPLQARAAARQALGDQRKPLPLEIQAQFPSSFVFTDEMGWIPEGWEITELKSFGEIVCGKTPSKAKPEYFGNDLPFIKIPDMHSSMFVTTSTEYLSKLGAESQAKKELPRGSVCVSCIATVGKVIITTEPSHTNQQINSIVPNDSFFTGYLYFSMLAKNKLFHDLASGGSATLNMNTSTFANVLMLKPSSALLKQFADSVSDTLAKVELNMRESETLGSVRDVLLPKLLSGELRVSDAEKKVAEAL